MNPAPPPELEKRYQRLLRHRAAKEIQTHMPLLRQLASECDHITEFGVKKGNSTTAFLAAQPKCLTSIDIANCPVIDELWPMRGATYFLFSREDSRFAKIEETDFLFIDSTHTGEHLRTELHNHSRKVNRFLGFHDTEVAGEIGFYYSNPEKKGVSIFDRGGKKPGEGILPVIREFVDVNPDWDLLIDDRRSHGVIILERHRA